MNTAEQRFNKVVKEFLENISSCISDLNDDGYSSVMAKDVNAMLGLIEKIKQSKMLKMFLLSSDSWERIMNRDIVFITQDVPEIYSNMGPKIVEALIAPFVCYSEAKKEGKKCPITDEDIDILWKFFSSMVAISCNHIVSVGKDKYPNIDVEQYSSKFGFTLIEKQ